jgi:P27 family predicted phage terminase small subunit
MSKGRKRIPDNLKVIAGTDQPCRMNPDAPAPAEDMPRPPAWLSRRAVEHFGALRSRFEYMSVATSTDTEMLALAAARLAEIEECDELIEEHGRLIESVSNKGTMVRANPAVGQRNEAMRHLHSLLSEFGASPASRSKVKAPKKKDDAPSPFTVIEK